MIIKEFIDLSRVGAHGKDGEPLPMSTNPTMDPSRDQVEANGVLLNK